MPILTWTYEPTNIMSTLKITFAGTNYQWFMPQLQGQRLSLTFDSSGTAQLWQDDSIAGATRHQRFERHDQCGVCRHIIRWTLEYHQQHVY